MSEASKTRLLPEAHSARFSHPRAVANPPAITHYLGLLDDRGDE
jgi:hypothetical protein